MSEDPPVKNLPVPQHSEPPAWYKPYLLPLDAFDRPDRKEYEKLKAGQEFTATEAHERLGKVQITPGQRVEYLRQLGMSASGALYPDNMARSDVDVRDPNDSTTWNTWRQVSEIGYLCQELTKEHIKAKTTNNLAFSLDRLLTPIMLGGESHPNDIKNELVGSSRSKGFKAREAAFKQAMQLLQHGNEDRRLELIDDLKLRLAFMRGEPDPVNIARQLIFSGMEDNDLRKSNN